MKKIFLLHIVMFLFGMSNFTYSNINIHSIDSLKSILVGKNNDAQKAELFKEISIAYQNKDSAIHYLKKAIKLIENKKGNEFLKSELYFLLSSQLMSIDIENSKKSIDKSIFFAQKIKNDSLLALNNLATATYFTYVPNTDSSIHYIRLATIYFKNIEDSTSLIYCYHNLMSNYNDVNNLDKTIEYGKKALDIALEIDETPVIGNIRIALGFTYSKLGKDSIADYYINKAKQDAETNKNYYLLLQIYLTTASKKYLKKDYVASIKDYLKANEIAKEKNILTYYSSSLFHLGQIYFKINNFKSAEEYLTKALKYDNLTPESLKNSYIYLSIIKSKTNFKKHEYYYAKFDSISTCIEKTKSEELLVKYETAEKQKEIELLKIKEIENELAIQKNKSKNYLLIAGLFISLLLLAMLFFRYRNKKKMLNKNIELEKQKTFQSKSIIEQKEREIALKIDAIKNNNIVIEDLKSKLEEASNSDENIKYIIESFDQNYVSDKQWDNIITHYNSINKSFIQELNSSYNHLTKNDIKLSILIKLNYSNPGMAEIMNISIEGVKKAKQRLKKKLII